MRHFDITLHGSGIQLFDSAGFEVPDDYNVPFPRNEKYLCIPTQPDHIGGIHLDIYENESFVDDGNLHHVFEGDIHCGSGVLVLETSLVTEICELTFNNPGVKSVRVLADSDDEPSRIALVLSDTATS